MARSPTNLLTHLVLAFPCLLIYELGVLLLGLSERNGADLITDPIGAFIGYRAFGLGLIGLFALLVLLLRRRQRFEWNALVPVLLESGIYALTMGTLIVFVMQDVLHMSPGLGVPIAQRQAGVLEKIVLSFGAGVHEEIFFRFILLGGLAFLGERLGFSRAFAVLSAFFLSATLFSVAHHLGPFGEPFRLSVFTYRLLAGLFFGLLFWFRGFAVAVWTHAFYDVYVMLLH